MSLGDWLLIGLLGVGAKALKNENEKQLREASAKLAESAKRKSCVCTFNDGISETEFNAIAVSIGKKIKRCYITTDGPLVFGKVTSNSGITTWSFTLDFNDYGHITGTFWLSSSNSDSSIPKRVGLQIQDEINKRI